MFNTTKTVRRMFIVAGLSTLAAYAAAFTGDPQVVIDRAIDSPTLTVRYTGVSASLIELRVNGASLGTRTLNAAKEAGETNFTLNLSDLKEGDNDVEVCIFDRTGKLVKSEHTKISTAPVQQGPVFLSGAKMGQTVRDSVQLDLGFNEQIKDPYVSFFVDGNFKAMMNVPPFTYTWDTQRESNGWHELEAWAIDASSTTHKTGKLRLFVDNSHGDTDRRGVNAGLETSPGLRELPVSPGVSTKFVKPTHFTSVGTSRTVVPSLPAASKLSALPIGNPTGTKPLGLPRGLSTGPYLMTPHKPITISKPVKVAMNNKRRSDEVIQITPTRVVTQALSAATLVEITKGSRLPDIGAFSIALDSRIVDFHGVMPRIDDGVPMTPLRFLLEKAGGKVDWQNYTKTVNAKTAEHDITLRIGEISALVNNVTISLEKAPYIDRGRTIVPLSFIRSTLDVDVQYDKDTGHVLITSTKK